LLRSATIAHHKQSNKAQQMSYKSLKQAADAVGVDRSTVHRAIKSGKISATKNEFGVYDIDPAELHRVFPPVVADELHNKEKKQTTTGNLTSENSVLSNTVEHLRELIKHIESERDDLRTERERLLNVIEEQAGSFKQLTHQKPAEPIENERAERERLLKVIEEQAESFKQLTHQQPAAQIEKPAPPRLVVWVVLAVAFSVVAVAGAFWLWFRLHAAPL
jgi:predicted site-specific integrase-resolvase